MIYKLINNSEHIYRNDGWVIPNDPDNSNYQRYLVWLEKGNTPEPADIPPLVIPTITMRQARLALLAAGLLDEVEAAITTPSDRIWWDYSATVERSHPLVDSVLRALDKTPTQINALFITAALL